MISKITIRPATAADVDVLLTMIRDLAIVNNDQATITADALRNDGFGERPWFRTLIAERDGKPAGYAFWYLAYNASYGTRVLHLHHLYVAAAHRKCGIGRALIMAVAREALARQCAGLVAGVVTENDDAIAFYSALGFRREHPPNPRFYLSGAEMADVLGAGRS